MTSPSAVMILVRVQWRFAVCMTDYWLSFDSLRHAQCGAKRLPCRFFGMGRPSRNNVSRYGYQFRVALLLFFLDLRTCRTESVSHARSTCSEDLVINFYWHECDSLIHF